MNVQVMINNRVIVKETVKATFIQKVIFTKCQVQMKVVFLVTLKIGTIIKRRDSKQDANVILTSQGKQSKMAMKPKTC